jgi:hypothetical protein
MPQELCWHCRQIKPDVTLCPSDDRLCRECFEANEVQLKLLKDQHKVAADDVLNQGSAATAAAPKPRSVRATDKKSVKKSANKPSTSDATATVDVATETTEVCYLADDKADNAFAAGPQSAHLAYHNELTELRRLVQNQQIVIDKLQSQLEFVLSFVGIKDKDAIPLSTVDQSDAGQASTQPPDGISIVDPGNDNDKSTWSEVVSRRNKRSGSLQQSVLTAVYVDQSLKKRQESSLIVSGLESVESKSDTDQFTALCDTEFHIQPSIVFTKRLGRPLNGKIQPLLVVLKQVDQAKRIISSAKLLRRSADSVVRSRVFINPNMTRAEAAAAYQLREQRRQTQQRRHVNRGHHTMQASVSSQISGGGSPAMKQDITNNQSLLNPLAGTFNPSNSATAQSD